MKFIGYRDLLRQKIVALYMEGIFGASREEVEDPVMTRVATTTEFLAHLGVRQEGVKVHRLLRLIKR